MLHQVAVFGMWLNGYKHINLLPYPHFSTLVHKANHRFYQKCCWNPGSIDLSLVYLKKKMVKAMAPHSSTLAWKIPWMEEPGRLQSMGSRRVGHDWATSLSLFTFMHWRRKWQPTPVFLLWDSLGQRSLVGCRLRGHTESDTTEAA